MKRLYVSQDPLLAGQIASYLEASGIRCLMRNQFLGGAAGELPLNECWPEIWVIEDSQFDRAQLLLDTWLRSTPAEEIRSWTCPRCGETIEPQFSHCWQCGTEHSAETQNR